MTMKLFKTKAVAVACSVLMMTGCGDIVIKVQKKPKNVDLSATSNFNALNLDDPTKADFLKHLDGLKFLAIDLLIKQLNTRDYRTEIRNQIRKYQDFLVAKASGPIAIDDSFYADAAECRESGLSFNMYQANDILGIILKTAVLSKLSEVNAGKISPHLTKEIQALGQLLLRELGLALEGSVDVIKDGDVTTTSGKFSLKLTSIEGEQISEEQKAKDAAQVLEVEFDRALGANYVGHFNSTISLTHLDAEGKEVTHAGNLKVKREAVEGMFLHTVYFDIGVAAGSPTYARELVFKQMATNKKQIQVMDTVNPQDPATKKTYLTLIDLDAGTQCKLALGEEPTGTSTATATATSTATSTVTETSTDTATDTSTGTDDGKDAGDDGDDSYSPPADGGEGDGSTDGKDGGDGSTDGKDGGDGSTDGKDGGDGSTDGKDGGDGSTDGKGDGDEDPSDDGKDDGNTPGQNPGQHPGQHPGQTK
jgi:hypothetical protein